MQRIYLVPGFFGFANLGDLRYFGHVYRVLEPVAPLHVVVTRPTASLRHRASRLVETIQQTAGPDDDLHIVAHSSGGLDARLLLSPGVQLGVDVEPVARRVRSLVTVATPHHGTPAAARWQGMAGGQLLRLLSLMTIVVLRRGGLSAGVLLRLGRLMRYADGKSEGGPGIVDELYTALLDELSEERRAAVDAFLTDVGQDQALLAQITPTALDVFNASTPNRPGVAYGCVVTRARRPDVGSVTGAGLSVYAQANLALYAVCHRLASWEVEPSWLDPEQIAALEATWPRRQLSDNDGMVPTTSQLHGTPIAMVDADHLDVIGHFTGDGTDPPHYDWLRTGTGFRRPAFDRTWDAVRRFLLATPGR